MQKSIFIITTRHTGEQWDTAFIHDRIESKLDSIGITVDGWQEHHISCIYGERYLHGRTSVYRVEVCHDGAVYVNCVRDLLSGAVREVKRENLCINEWFVDTVASRGTKED